MAAKRRRISVALCTCEGAAFLGAQLASLAEQTRLPDELVVFDDASSDNTIELLEAFSRSGPGFAVQIHRNSQRIGTTANFEQAIGACTGEIIALCDQDDVWLNEKLSQTEAAFDREPNLGFVFGDAEICDEACRPWGYRLWDSVLFNRAMRLMVEQDEAFEMSLRKNVVTGATMAFAAWLRPLVLPIDPHWVHDGWIALLAAAVAPVAMIEEPVILYRQHPRQAIGAAKRTLYQQYLSAKQMDRDVFSRHADMYEAALRRLLEAKDLHVPPRAIALLRQKIRHFRVRSEIRRRERSRVLPSVRELLTLRYRNYSLGWKSFAQDLFL